MSIDLVSHGLDNTTFVPALQKALANTKDKNIVVCNLKQNKLDIYCLEYLLSLMVSGGPLSDLRELNLNNCFTESVGDAACEKLKMVLKFNSKKLKLIKIDLGYNGITKNGLPHLAEALYYSCPELQDVNLRYNSISAEGAAALQAFFSLPKMASLDLTGNAIGDQGCTYVCSFAAACTSLQRLSLWGNGISDVAAPYLVQLVNANQSLQILDLSSNTLTQPSLELLFSAIDKNNKGLLDVGLFGNNINDRYVLQKFKDMFLKRAAVKQFQQESQKTNNYLNESTVVLPTVPQNNVHLEWVKLNEAKQAFELEKATFYQLKQQKEKEWNELEGKIEQHVQLIVQKLQQQGQLGANVKINLVLNK